MAFREKSAWIMLLALVLGGAVYAYLVAATSTATGGLAPPLVPTFALYVLVLILVAIVGHGIVAALASRDAGAPADERDRAVTDRAGHLSSCVLGVGVVLSLLGYLASYEGHLLFYGVLASLMLAQAAEYALQIYLYRRGW